jgi:4'-phosphopantetheinyl transferase
MNIRVKFRRYPDDIEHQPKPDDIEAWRFVLNPPEEERSTLSSLLSSGETSRKNTYKDDHLRRRFEIRHSIKRIILSRYVSLSPERLRFVTGENGKPHLAGNSRIDFNISCTCDQGFLVLSNTHTVGCDIELEDREVDVDSLAKRVMSESELKRFDRFAMHNRRYFFFQLWTQKEAILKAMGVGFTTIEPSELEIMECGRFAQYRGSRVPAFIIAKGLFQNGYHYAVSVVESENKSGNYMPSAGSHSSMRIP